MELMFLILGETICNSSCAITYLATDFPTSWQKAICPISLIKDNDDPYWKNHIEKYFDWPEDDKFTNLTYSECFQNYEITITQPTTKCPVYINKLKNYVIKRTTSNWLDFI